MSSKTIQMPLEEWQEQINKRVAAENHAADLQRQLNEAKMCGSDPLVQLLTSGFLGAYELVKFCIAHAHPEVVKTQAWPHEALVLFANALEAVPLVDPAPAIRQEAAIDMRHMAGEAAHWNKVRAERKLALDRGQDIPEVINLPPIIE